MTITWLGHSCFLLESGGYRVLLDPFKDVPGLPDTRAEAHAVYCSHGHFDHNYTDQVTLLPEAVCPFTVRETETFHDGRGGALRGRNTVRSFTAGGVTAVHLGDLGHTLSAAQIDSIGPCDVLLVPVGGTYTVDAAGAKAAVDALKPRIVIPMHYRCGKIGFDDIGPVEPFLALFPPDMVRRCGGNTLAVDRDTPAQVAVLAVEL